MSKAITLSSMKEGEIFLKWLDSKLIKNNKNVLGANLGPTGSGKSYRDLRMAELWYDYHFKEKVPLSHICFGVGQAMKLISSGKMRRGDIIIFEEAGVNLGSLDFQNEVSKMMNYTLQSFRSMNIAIFFNLPYLSMMNKSARMLMHYSFESAGIDKDKGINKCKPFFHQVNQGTGKIYKKYPIISVNSSTKKVKKFTFSKPSQYLIDSYEKKKQEYLITLTQDFSKRLEEIENGKKGKKVEHPTEEEFECFYEHKHLGLTFEQIAEKRKIGLATAYRYSKKVEKWKEARENITFTKEKQEFPL